MDRSDVLGELASDTIDAFERIADAAEQKLAQPGIGINALANVNQLTTERAHARFVDINDGNDAAYRRLRDEPAIARVVVEDEEGRRETLYVARATRVDCGVNLCSYLTPKGRLASLPVGDAEEIVLPRGRVWYEVVERTAYRPERRNSGWDSRNTVFHSDAFGPVTIGSLRELLSATLVADEEDIVAALDKLIEDDAAAANVQQGLKRSILTAMELRDQPLLDQFQDAIFRMPLGRQIVIIGPPGTGKTTTLIRRLKQKLDYLEPEERELVEATDSRSIPHSHSWLMFTPTELLKQYVREAFAREDVPAPDRRIRTWDDHRRELARNLLPVLKSASGGTLVMNEQKEVLQPSTKLDQIEWYEDFSGFHQAEFLRRLSRDADTIAGAKDATDAALGKRLTDLLAGAGGRSLVATILAVTGFSDDLRRINTAAHDATRNRLRHLLAEKVRRDPGLLDDLARFAGSLDDEASDEEQDELESDVEADEDEGAPVGNRAAGQAEFLKAARAKAVAQARKRTIKPASRSGRMLAWLAERGVELPDLAPIGEVLIVQQAARRLMRAPRDYVRQVPGDYRAFRRSRASEGKWYIPDVLTAREVNAFEVDVILLAMLRNARALLSDRALMRRLDGDLPLILEQVKGAHRNQILVDEAPDFSPVQLACMAALASLRTESFFACGDFNQRLTLWGSRSRDQFAWVYPDVEVKPVTVSYRQSRQLNELARGLIKDGDQEALGTLPEHMDNEGVPPVLGRDLGALDGLAGWLAARIVEIEKFTGKLPSIAILVNDRDDVEPLAATLDNELRESNIRAVASLDGRVMGRENDVRVFEVKHIKGLEFEAVFFVDVDRLEAAQPGLFEKYLYVGATRAATYLGMTTASPKAPELIESRADSFAESWS